MPTRPERYATIQTVALPELPRQNSGAQPNWENSGPEPLGGEENWESWRECEDVEMDDQHCGELEWLEAEIENNFNEKAAVVWERMADQQDFLYRQMEHLRESGEKAAKLGTEAVRNQCAFRLPRGSPSAARMNEPVE